jgi:hypothetical protein
MIPSPNYQSRGGAAVRLLVVHTTENDADVTSAADIAAYFSRSASQVSAHVVIDDDTVIQCVDYGNACWAVAGYNNVSESAEMVGRAAYGTFDWQRHAGTIARAVQWLRDRSAARGIPLVYLSAADVAAGRSGWTSHLNLGQLGGGHHDPGDAAIAALINALEDNMPAPADLVDYAVGYKDDGTPITISTAIQDLAKLTKALGLGTPGGPAGTIASAVLDFPLNGPKNTLSMAAQALNTGTATVKATATVDQAALTAAVQAAVKAAGVTLTAADMQAACAAAVKSLHWSAA